MLLEAQNAMTSIKHSKRRGCVVGLGGICCICILLIIYNYAFHNYLLLEPYDTMPYWSPDGQRVVFACLRRERARDQRFDIHFGPYEGYDQFKLKEICVVDSNGRNRLQLTDNHISDDFPVWSPDGRQIAYVSGPKRGQGDIYLTEVDAWHPVNVTQNPAHYGLIHWSPSGEYLAFTKSKGDGLHRLFVLRLRDGEVIPLAPSQQVGYFRDLVWSPDSEFVAFIAGDYPDNEVYTVSILDTKIESITHNSSRRYTDLAWSPDGQYISYVASWKEYSFSTSYHYQVCMLNVDTHSETVIAESVWPLGKTAWSSDGRFLSYMDGGPVGRQSLHIRDLVEGSLVVSSKIGNVLSLNWMPDSHQLLVNRFDDWNHDGHTEPKLWLLDIETGRLTPLSGWFPWQGREVQLDFN